MRTSCPPSEPRVFWGVGRLVRISPAGWLVAVALLVGIPNLIDNLSLTGLHWRSLTREITSLLSLPWLTSLTVAFWYGAHDRQWWHDNPAVAAGAGRWVWPVQRVASLQIIGGGSYALVVLIAMVTDALQHLWGSPVIGLLAGALLVLLCMPILGYGLGFMIGVPQAAPGLAVMAWWADGWLAMQRGPLRNAVPRGLYENTWLSIWYPPSWLAEATSVAAMMVGLASCGTLLVAAGMRSEGWRRLWLGGMAVLAVVLPVSAIALAGPSRQDVTPMGPSPYALVCRQEAGAGDLLASGLCRRGASRQAMGQYRSEPDPVGIRLTRADHAGESVPSGGGSRVHYALSDHRCVRDRGPAHWQCRDGWRATTRAADVDAGRGRCVALAGGRAAGWFRLRGSIHADVDGGRHADTTRCAGGTICRRCGAACRDGSGHTEQLVGQAA